MEPNAEIVIVHLLPIRSEKCPKRILPKTADTFKRMVITLTIVTVK
ncbi:hypothetical protein QS257_21005 [Terrilactibacillus sp. S3-3]|nr:hypothetical protein QS257_21005 [Terrilactibacillus sp. S3-3]